MGEAGWKMLKAIRVAGLVLTAVALTAMPAIAGEYHCKFDDSTLRIAIEVKKAGHTLPCEVVAEDDRNERAVLYSAQFDRNYCPQRLEQKRAELEEEGWNCKKSSDINIVRGTDKLLPVETPTASKSRAIAPNGAAISEHRVCKLNDDTRRLQIEVEDPNSGKPCKLVYWSESDRSESGQLLWRAEHDSEFCTKRLSFIVQKWGDEGWTCGDGDDETQRVALPTPTEEPTTPSSAEEDSQVVAKAVDAKVLQAIIEADARRIGEWMEVEPDIEVAAHGDLNDDGNDDAIVFLAYQSKQAAYRQYMMSYLVADETYELAGVKLLTGVSPPPAQAKVRQIDDGVIWLSLPGNEGTSPKPVGYVLRDQQLVEVDSSQEAESTSN